VPRAHLFPDPQGHKHRDYAHRKNRVGKIVKHPREDGTTRWKRLFTSRLWHAAERSFVSAKMPVTYQFCL
jgi:hypothetical protein